MVRPVFASDAENIAACAKAAKDFANVTLNQFNASYEGNIFAQSVAKWSNVYCEVKLGDVYTLQVNGKDYIYKDYAGKASYDLNSTLKSKTDEAIRQLKTRISLLEERASQVSENLKKPNPDRTAAIQFVDDGIRAALGPSAQSPSGASKASPTPQAALPTVAPAPQADAKEAKKLSQLQRANSQKAKSSAGAKSADDWGKKNIWMERGKDAVREKLKDPRSAEFRNVFFHRGPDGVPMTCGEVNSKNSFGGRRGFQKFVSAGQVDLTYLEEEVSDFYTVWNRLCVR